MTDNAKTDIEFYETPYGELDATLRGDVPITCSRCGDSLECPITNTPCPICVKGGEIGVGVRAKPPAHELGTMVLPPTIQIHFLHPTPPQKTNPFSLHLLEWVRFGHGWWGALFGFYPRVGEGEIDGHTWFFRARGKRWRLFVGTTSGSWAEDEFLDDVGEFHLVGEWHHPELNAGDMPDDDAWAIIERGFEQWRATYAQQLEAMMSVWDGEGGRCS